MADDAPPPPSAADATSTPPIPGGAAPGGGAPQGPPPDVKAGDTLAFTCPTGTEPAVKAGDLVPTKEDPAFFVLHVEGQNLTLGPMKPGEVTSLGLCTGTETRTLRVEATSQEEVPKFTAPPLPPGVFEYPLWLWIVLALIIALLAAAGLYAWRWYHKRSASRRPALPLRTVPPDEAFEIFLRLVRDQKMAENADKAASKKLYGEGSEKLRGFLQLRLRFEAPGATSREFVSELKSALLVAQREGRSLPPHFGQIVESLLTQADQVNFAGETPPTENRVAFAKALEKVAVDVKPAVPTPTATAKTRAAAPKPATVKPEAKKS
jgi:hypothetical protein